MEIPTFHRLLVMIRLNNVRKALFPCLAHSENSINGAVGYTKVA